MYTPYNPCNECVQKGKMCSQCGYRNVVTNYNKALEKLRELCAEYGKPTTILT